MHMNVATRTRSVLCTLSFALLLLLFYGAPAVQGAEVVDRIVAVVNGRLITLSEVNQNLEVFLKTVQESQNSEYMNMDVQDLRRRILDKMIADILIEEQAKRYQIEVSDGEIRSFLDRFKEQNNLTQEQLEGYLTQQGMTLEGYKDRIRRKMLRDRLVTAMVNRKIIITDEEVEQFYQEHKGEISGAGADALRLSLIVLGPTPDPDDLRSSIVAGEMTFSAAAKKYSVGPAAEQGGDLGMVDVKDLAPEIKAVASNLQIGQVSKPFVLGGKPAFILLASGDKSSSNTGAPALTDAVRDQIRSVLAEQKSEKLFKEYTQRLRENAVIDDRL